MYAKSFKKPSNPGSKTNSRISGTTRQPKDILKSNVWPALSEQKSASLPEQIKSTPSDSNKTNIVTRAKSYVCIPVDELSDKKIPESNDAIETLTKRVAELETSYANLIDMYKTQIKINDTLGNNISILATYCLLAMDTRMNNYAHILPLMIQPHDQKNVFKMEKPLVRILERDNGSIIASMLECRMYGPLVESMFGALRTKHMVANPRFVENVKSIILNTPWNLLISGTGMHVLDAISICANNSSSDHDLWQDLYACTLSRRPVN